ESILIAHHHRSRHRHRMPGRLPRHLGPAGRTVVASPRSSVRTLVGESGPQPNQPGRVVVYCPCFTCDETISSTHHLIEAFMNGPWIRGFVAPVILALGTGGGSAQSEPGVDSNANRKVLVELYTSQGCDMCPAAEKLLGALAERDRRIVPIAFHVD